MGGAMVLGVSVFLLAGTTSAHKTPTKKPAAEADPPTCVINSLPSFMDQGYGINESSSVADIIEIECQPIYAEQTVKVSSDELYSRCAKNLSWTAIGNNEEPYQPTGPQSPGISGVQLDDDGNATVVAWGGPSCATGESMVSVHMEDAPYETFATSFTVTAPKPTPPGVWALPSSQVEVGDWSSFATIIEVEFPPVYAEASVVISAEQLFSRCGKITWIGPDEKLLSSGEEVTVKLDDDGNAFVVLLGGPSCASGLSEIEASLTDAPYTTYVEDFTILPPEPTVGYSQTPLAP
jgi:hypothetical protein